MDTSRMAGKLCRWLPSLLLMLFGPAGVLAQEISLQSPTRGQLFRAESEEQARARLRASYAEQGIRRIEFPADSPPAMVFDANLVARPAQVIARPAGDVCYGRLYFEDPRTERAMCPCGVLEPVRSATRFYGIALTLPACVILHPPWRRQCCHH